MEDEASDFSDWEVLSAASGAGGHEDAVLVSGEGGDILHDHFALYPSSPAGFSGNRSWSEAASDDVEIESGLGSLERFGSAPQPQELMDLIAAVDSSAQLRLGGVDVIAQASSVLGASVGCGGGAQEKQAEVLSYGEFDLVPQAALQGVEEISESDATAVANVRLQTEPSDKSSLQLKDGGADAISESSVLQAAATSGAMQTLQEETEQGKDASATPGYAEPGGDGNDGSSRLFAAAAPVTGEGERQVLVWWRLPFRLIQYFAWKMRPVWSMSIATALLGLAVLGRRMYRMRRKTRGLPQIKISFDDKIMIMIITTSTLSLCFFSIGVNYIAVGLRPSLVYSPKAKVLAGGISDSRASQFADRAARLSEAFFIAKRVPALLRTSSGAALPWSMMQER